MIELGDFRYDPESRLLYRGDEEILLPPRVIAVLESLLKRPAQVVPKEDLLASAWDGAFVGEHSLTQAVSRLRQVLGDDPQRPVYIQTVPRRGYRLICDVSEPLERDSDAGLGQPSRPDAGMSAAPADGSRPGGSRLEVEQLEPGSRLGRYEILGAVGSGAMGDVWHARDPELGREVALKLVPPHLTNDPTAMGRFRREARLLAALDHPSIAKIYTVETVASTRFIVMELVEGETLEQRLRNGALSIQEALGVALQIARALEAAHRNGIVHRDLKPANVMVTGEGQVKLLDFGLAKEVRPPATEDGSDPVTLTGTGTTLGTAPYMSPEQARGKEVDHQTDIWAFGCVVHELLSGDRAFAAETPSDTVAAVLKDEPEWEALPAATPAPVVMMLRRCLHKDPDRRLHHIADARIEIEEALSEPTGALKAPGGDATTPQSRGFQLILLGLAAALAAAIALVWTMNRSSVPSPNVSYVDLNLPVGTHLWGGDPNEARIGSTRPSRTAFALTADGGAIVFSASDGETGRLYLRRLEEPQARPIAGTEGGSSPFVSPEGDRVGFVVDGEIRTVRLEGGEPRTLVRNAGIAYGAGLHWADDGSIVYGAPDGIYRVPAGGGTPERITTGNRDRDELEYAYPELLPSEDLVLYTVLDVFSGHGWENSRIVAQPLGGDPVVLVRDGIGARYSPTGHLLFARRGTLMAAGFDPVRMELTSEPVEVLGDLMQAIGAGGNTNDTGAPQFSLSDSGALAYVSGGLHPEIRTPLVWVDRDGDVEPVSTPAWNQIFWNVRISPDGRRVAYSGPRFAPRDILVLDLTTGATTRLELPDLQVGPVWSPDGTQLAFASRHETTVLNLYRITADLAGDPQRVTESGLMQFAAEWTDDDRLLFWQGSWPDDPLGDIRVMEVDGSSESVRVVGGPAAVYWPALSPEGRWLAYASTKTGRDEIYVRPYPRGDAEYQVSRDGGARPAWSRDGGELFYRAGRDNRQKMMSVEVEPGTVFRWSHPRELFDRYMLGTSSIRSYDVAPDGRFIMQEPWNPPHQPVTELRLILNWFEELERLVPASR